MSRKHHHEDHTNHEAWAIPYGDLITLLLAFFVVMYAISSVNEGKYRVLADSLSEAFGGTPRTIKPISMGATQVRGSELDRAPPMQTVGARGPVAPIPLQNWQQRPQVPRDRSGTDGSRGTGSSDRQVMAAAQAGLKRISDEIENALAGLIARDLVTVRRTELWVEVEIKSDILFASGVARPMPEAMPTLAALANALEPFPNLIRIEGHTDDVPISTSQFPSNWELSSARAASVLHLFVERGIVPQRLTLIGNGEYRPVADNATAQGRNANRRVLIVILAHIDDEDFDRPASQADDPIQPDGIDGIDGVDGIEAASAPAAAADEPVADGSDGLGDDD
jgi:chemotaxis protein MotB